MIDHRHVIFVLAVVKVAKRDVTAVRSLSLVWLPTSYDSYFCVAIKGQVIQTIYSSVLVCPAAIKGTSLRPGPLITIIIIFLLPTNLGHQRVV